MTDEQNEAVAALKAYRDDDPGGPVFHDDHISTILAMLAEPRLPRPEDVPDELLHKIWQASSPTYGGTVSERGRRIYQVFYNHYTAPRTVWRVREGDKYTTTTRTFDDEDSAFAEVKRLVAAGLKATVSKQEARDD
jgi:hypothetical protein